MDIKVTSISVKRSDNLVLNDLCFHVNRGEIYALLGSNGAGKSTTLLTILGFLHPLQGVIEVGGMQPIQNLQATRRLMTYIPEATSLYEHLNAYENIRYFLAVSKIEVAQSQISDALQRVALDLRQAKQPLKSYSKGMRQKVALCLMLLRDTPILLLDEPTSGLDPNAMEDFNKLLTTLADMGKTIMMVTHDVYCASQIAHRIGLIHKGHLQEEYSNTETEAIDARQLFDHLNALR